MEAWKEDQLNALLASCERGDLFETVAGMARALGFEHCAYGMRAPLPLTQPEIVMLNDYPAAWQKRYQSNGYLQAAYRCRRSRPTVSAAC